MYAYCMCLRYDAGRVTAYELGATGKWFTTGDESGLTSEDLCALPGKRIFLSQEDLKALVTVGCP